MGVRGAVAEAKIQDQHEPGTFRAQEEEEENQDTRKQSRRAGLCCTWRHAVGAAGASSPTRGQGLQAATLRTRKPPAWWHTRRP